MGRYINANQPYVAGQAKQYMFKTPATDVSQTWTVPADTFCATFEIWGGGGSGAGGMTGVCCSGGGGGGGGYSMTTIPVTPGTNYTIYVGRGGLPATVGGNSGCGCSGGTTYVTGSGLSGFCATGGSYGVCQTGGLSSAGTGYGGLINLTGECGLVTYGQGAPGSLSRGGASPFGGGTQIMSNSVGYVTTDTGCGITGIFPGGGGSQKPEYTPGWCDCNVGTSGAGADGFVRITI